MSDPTVNRDSGIDLDVDEMRTLGYRIVDSLVAHYDELRDKPVSRISTRQTLAESPPEQGTSPLLLVDQLEKEVFSNIMFTLIRRLNSVRSLTREQLVAVFRYRPCLQLAICGYSALQNRSPLWSGIE